MLERKHGTPEKKINCTRARMMKNIAMYNLESGFQHGMWDICQESGGEGGNI